MCIFFNYVPVFNGGNTRSLLGCSSSSRRSTQSAASLDFAPPLSNVRMLTCALPTTSCCSKGKPDGKILLLEHGRGYFDFMNNALDDDAHAHAAKWGCWWNRPIGELVDESTLEVESTSRWHFGTTWMITANPNKDPSTAPAIEYGEDVYRAYKPPPPVGGGGAGAATVGSDSVEGVKAVEKDRWAESWYVPTKGPLADAIGYVWPSSATPSTAAAAAAAPSTGGQADQAKDQNGVVVANGESSSK